MLRVKTLQKTAHLQFIAQGWKTTMTQTVLTGSERFKQIPG